MNVFSNLFAFSLLASMALACGSESGSNECQSWSDCGDRGQALCLDGSCSLPGDGQFGSVNVTLSFGRDDYQVAASGRVHFVHPHLADGSELTCEKLQQGERSLDDNSLNPLQTQPKSLQFHWAGGGTYFPDNLIQFIQPCQQALVVAEGFSGLNAEGDRTVFGCVSDVNIQTSETATEVTVSMVRQ